MKLTDPVPAAFALRRARLASAMQSGVAVVPTAPERIRNRDTHYPFRFDSHFWYLTGFPEPEAVLDAISPHRFRGNDLIVFHVLAPAELDFGFGEAAPFEDLTPSAMPSER